MPISGMEGSPLRPGDGTPAGPRNFEAGMLLIAVGAIMLFVSLFLHWYSPNAEAWDVFEVWDLVLAALAIAALVAAAGRMGIGPPRPPSWLIGSSMAALVIVLYALIDPPPIAAAIGAQGGGFGDPDTGLWIALAATILMTAGALLSVARISVAFTAGPGLADRAPGLADRGPGLADRGRGLADRGPGMADPGPGSADRGRGLADRGPGLADRGPGPADPGPGHADPARSYRRRTVDPSGSNPAVPQPPRVPDPRVADPAGTRRSGRFTRGAPGADRDPPDPLDPGPIPPTEESRRRF